MNNELIMGRSAHLISKKEENPDVRNASPQNITVVLPSFNKEVSIDSIVLLTRYYADNVIVIDGGSSDLTAKVAKLILPIFGKSVDMLNGGSKGSQISQLRYLCGSFGNKSGLFHNFFKSLSKLLQTQYQPCGNSKPRNKAYSVLNFQTGTSFIAKTEYMVDRTHFGSRRNFLFLFSRIRSPKFSFFDLVIS
jgi:hypothetical protein